MFRDAVRLVRVLFLTGAGAVSRRGACRSAGGLA
jgi:hypothetical protein